ncbi:MAG: hypothetical protein AAFW95_13235 [Cyanobacteria bacterium J06638_6]
MLTKPRSPQNFNAQGGHLFLAIAASDRYYHQLYAGYSGTTPAAGLVLPEPHHSPGPPPMP